MEMELLLVACFTVTIAALSRTYGAVANDEEKSTVANEEKKYHRPYYVLL